MNNKITRLYITPGEPAGIGPDVVIQAAQRRLDAEVVVVADPDLLLQRAKQLNLPLILDEKIDAITPHEAGHLKALPVRLPSAAIAGQLNPDHAAYVIETLTLATNACLSNPAHALVTAPVNKSVMNEAGIAFRGHTEFLAQLSGVKQTVMLFVVDQLKVALATTHLPLKDVSAAITEELLQSVLTIVQGALVKWFKLANPRMLVCGLNPHAGENGYLGREEIDVIAPALDALKKQGMNILGPLPADTIFTPKLLNQADAVLSMYHDQALPLVKYLGFNHAVNVTLGLPFVRTSVDHGTAIDIAGTGQADAGSLLAAIELAISLKRELT